MAYANGRLPSRALAPITKAANGEQAHLRADVATAFMAMNQEAEDKHNLTLRVASARVAYRTYEQQVYFWNLYQSGKGSLAAHPGTSNHGLGLAVDLATPQMRSVADQIGSKYGWAKRWSDAPSEWWHLKWKEGDYPAVKSFSSKWDGYTAAEIRWIQEYDKLQSANQDKARRIVLRQVMTEQRKRIWTVAQSSGWDTANRRARYNSLAARTK